MNFRGTFGVPRNCQGRRFQCSVLTRRGRGGGARSFKWIKSLSIWPSILKIKHVFRSRRLFCTFIDQQRFSICHHTCKSEVNFEALVAILTPWTPRNPFCVGVDSHFMSAQNFEPAQTRFGGVSFTHIFTCVFMCVFMRKNKARAVPGARPPRNCPAIFREHEADQHGCKGEGTFSSEIHHKGARDGVRGKAERPGRSFITRKR